MKILHDAIDLMLLRVKPLTEYRYPWWQAILIVVAIAASGVGLVWFHTSKLNALLFIVALQVMALLLIDRTLRFWLTRKWALQRGYSQWDGQGRFFSLLVLASTPWFFLPLLLDPKNTAIPVLLPFTLLFFAYYLPVHAVARATGSHRFYVLLGFLLSTPLLLWLWSVASVLLTDWQWVTQADVEAMLKQLQLGGK